MARLTFPVQPDGLIVDVLVGLDRQALDDLRARGKPLPTPLTCLGALDTGSDISAMNPDLPVRLGLTPKGQTRTHTATGQVSVDLYAVSLSITNLQTPGAPWLTVPTLTVMGLQAPLPTVEVLIGLDVLLTCQLFLDGPGQTFSLDC
jgi:Aspartyl protease